MKKKWIQKAIGKNRRSLHSTLGIKKDDKIPLSLLNKIIKAEAGDTIKNPSKKGKSKIEVSRTIEREAILARNLKKISAKRKKRI